MGDMDQTTEDILKRTRERRQKLDNELTGSPGSSPKLQHKKIMKRKSSELSGEGASRFKTDIDTNPPSKKSSFNENDEEKPRRPSVYPTEELGKYKEDATKSPGKKHATIEASATRTPVPLSPKQGVLEVNTAVKMSNECTPMSRKSRLAALAAHLDEFEVDMKTSKAPSNLPKSEFQVGSSSVESLQRKTPTSARLPKVGENESLHVRFDDNVMAKTISTISSFTTDSNDTLCSITSVDQKVGSPDKSCGLEAFSRPRSRDFDQEDESSSSSLEERSSSRDVGMWTENVANNHGGSIKTTTRSCEMTTEVIRKIKSPSREDPVSSIIDSAKKATEGAGDPTIKQNVGDVVKLRDKKPEAATPSDRSSKVASMTGHWESRVKAESATPRSGFDTPLPAFWIRKSTFDKPFSKPVLPNSGLRKQAVQATPKDSRVSPLKETGDRKTTVNELKKRWEISSATGSPLHPADDLTKAAVRLAGSGGRGPNPPREQPKAQSMKEKYFSKSELPSAKSQPVPEEEDEESCGSDTADNSQVSSGGGNAPSSEAPTEDSEEADAFDSELDDCLEEALGISENLVESERHPIEALPVPLTTTPKITVSSAVPGPPAGTGTDSYGSLVHTVSFYRSQQKQSRKQGHTEGATPVVVRQPMTSPQNVKGERTNAQRKAERAVYENKIKAVNEAVGVQQEQIAQASRALNFCRTTTEFRGSREEVDAQRALLLATERRRCLIEELERVNTCRREGRPLDYDGPRGTLTISHMSIPLKREFVNDNINMTSGDLLHYFICLLKHRESVHATQMVTSDEGLRMGHLEFSNYVQLSGLPHDFNVKLEIYGLRTKREEFTHEEKYRIKGGSLKKSKSHFTPGLSSPGGPMAVLDPSFQKLGYLQLSLHAVNRGKFRLDGVQFSCPIEGAVLMKLRCFAESAGEVEDQGFLSAYEEVSGLGSWTRLWCVLKKGAMKFWRYPDEQSTKEPLNVVDLGRCITDNVRLMDRETCSRSNTFFVDIVAEIDSHRRTTETFRIMLSADTKDECHRWCESINDTLINTRMWNPESSRLDVIN